MIKSGFIRKAAGFFVGLGLFLFMLLVMVLLVVNTSFVREKVLARINQQLPGSLAVEHLNLALLSGVFDARGLSLRDAGGQPLVEVDRLFVNVSYLPLLMRNLVLEDVRVEGPRIQAATDEAGQWNLIGALIAGDTVSAPETAFPGALAWNLKIRDLDLNRGALTYRAAGKQVARVENLSLSANGINVLKKTGGFSLQLGPSEIRVNDQATGFETLALAGRMDPNRLSLETLNLRSDLGELEGRGTIVELWDHPRLDLSLNLIPSLAELDRVLGLSMALSGRPHLELTATGDYDNPDLSLRISGRNLSILDQSFDAVNLETTCEERQVSISRLEGVTGYGSALLSGVIDLRGAFSGGSFPGSFDPEQLAYTMELDLALEQAHRVPGLKDILNGPLTLHAQITGQGIFPERIRARGQIEAESPALSLWESPHADYHVIASLACDKGQLTVQSATLDNAGNRLSLTGMFDLRDKTWAGDLDLDAVELSQIALFVPYVDARGRLALSSNWTGTGGTWEARFTGKGQDLVTEDIFLGGLEAEAVLYSSGILTVPRLVLTQDTARVTARGQLGLFDEAGALDVDVTVHQLDLSRLTGLKDLRALADGRIRLGGTLGKPRAEVRARGLNLGWQQLTLGDLNLVAVFEEGRLTVSDLNLLKGQSALKASGRVQVFEPDTWALNREPSGHILLSGPDLRLEDFYPGLRGALSIDARVDGPFGDMTGHINVDGQALDLFGQHLEQVTLATRLDGADLVIDRGDIRLAPDQDIRIRGLFSLGTYRYELSLNTSDLSLSHLAPMDDLTWLDGRIRVDLAGEGSLDHPVLNATVAVTDIRINREPFEPGTFFLSLADRSAEMTGHFLGEIGARLQLDTHAFESQIRFDRTDLAALFAVAGYGGLGGDISGQVSAVGDLDDPDAIRVDGGVSHLAVRSGALDLITGEPLTFTYARRAFELPETRLVLLDKGNLTVAVRGHLDGELDGRARGTIPLAVLEPFVEVLNTLDGQLDLSLALSGPVAHPDVEGRLVIDSVSFVVPELMQTVHDVNGLVRLTGDAIMLEGVTGGLDSGRFDLRGQWQLVDLKPGELSLELTGEALPLSLPDTLDLSFNTRLTMTGTPDKTLLKGNLMLLEGQYYKDVTMNLLRVVGTKTRDTAPEKAPVTLPYLRNMVLDLSLRHRNPFEVDNNLALLELKPDLRLYGTLAQPLISGRAQVVADGVITYQGIEFEVERGVVDFLNPYRIEPTLDVECKTEIRSWTLTLSVFGPLDNLKFTLRSNPHESDEDILALLLFGQTTREMRNSGADSSQSAAQMLADALSRHLEKNIKEATGMDTVEVDYSSEGPEKRENGVRVTVGKELSERLTVKYGVETKNAEAVQRAISEYKFFENLMINAYQDTANDFGAELVYRIEFR